MKIITKVHKLLSVIIVAGLVLPVGLTAASVDNIETLFISNSQIVDNAAALPSLSVVTRATSSVVTTLAQAVQACGLSRETGDVFTVQGQRNINLYQPADCYRFVVAQLPSLPRLSLAVNTEFARVQVVAQPLQISIPNKYTTTQYPDRTRALVVNTGVSTEVLVTGRTHYLVRPLQSVSTSSYIVDSQHTYQLVQTFRC